MNLRLPWAVPGNGFGARLRPVVVAAAAAAAAIAKAPGDTFAADHNDPIGVQTSFQGGDSAAGYEISTNDPAADIADLFAWYTGPAGAPESVVLALTWRADPLDEREKAFDPSVAYGIHIDTSDKGLLDLKISTNGVSVGSKLFTKASYDVVAWFGESKSKKGAWGLLVHGLPGVEGDVVGPVGKVLTPAPGVKIAAGLFDDPFFADLDAFFDAISVALGNVPGANPSLPLDRFNPVDPARQTVTRPFGYPVGVDGFGRQNIHAIVIELPASAFPSQKIHVWGTTERKQGLAKSGHALQCTYDGTYHCVDAQNGGAQ